MRKPPFIKARQCSNCIFFVPAMDLNDASIIGHSRYKEACRLNARAFTPFGEDAEICFDYKSIDRESSLNTILSWKVKHPCSKCAFFEENGRDFTNLEDYQYSVDVRLRKPEHSEEERRALIWDSCRCSGYWYVPNESFCRSFLTIEQWKAIESTPWDEDAKAEKLEEFRQINVATEVWDLPEKQ